MARRWRIRHKLMLGLATAIAILAVLLAVTLNGLWSFYVTTKGIECKLTELDEAENLKKIVDELCRAPRVESLPSPYPICVKWTMSPERGQV